ncbi:MAG: hypothetical protein HYW93_01280 [Thaumarchaeota archaeon]|nr:hypothetical protein [Nitrososphaerota archaeon]
MVQQGSVVGTAFHPELSGSTLLHEYLIGFIDSPHLRVSFADGCLRGQPRGHEKLIYIQRHRRETGGGMTSFTNVWMHQRRGVRWLHKRQS